MGKPVGREFVRVLQRRQKERRASPPAPPKEMRLDSGLRCGGSHTSLDSPFARPALPLLLELLGHGDPLVRAAAAEVLGTMGKQAEDAIPALAASLEDHDPRMRAAGGKALSAMRERAIPHLVRVLREGQLPARISAANALGRIRREELEVVMALLKATKERDSELRVRAAVALAWVSPDRVPSHLLVEGLESKDGDLQDEVLKVLRSLGPSAEAVPGLTRLLHGLDSGRRRQAASLLAEAGADGTRVLVATLRHREVVLRIEAARALARAGRAADAIVPILLRGMESRDHTIRSEAASALAALGPKARPAVPSLLLALGHESPKVRFQAARALRGIGPAAEQAVPALGQLLKDPDREVRWTATESLKGIGDAAVPVLLRALSGEDVDGRRRAASALQDIGIEHDVVLPHFVQALSDPDKGGRSWGVRYLARLESEAVSAIPELTALLKNDPHEYVRAGAARAMGQIAPEAKDTVLALRKALHDPERSVRCAAAGALGKAGTTGSQAILSLIRALRDKDGLVRAAAVAALGSVGQGSEEAADQLLAVLDDDFHTVRQNAVKFLCQVSGRCNLDALERALADPSPPVRKEAVRALESLGPRARRAAPKLEELLESPDRQLAKAAAKALAEIDPRRARKSVVPVLVDAMRAHHSRAWALATLGDMGRVAAPALQTITDSLDDRDPGVRMGAAAALRGIGRDARSSIPALEARLADDHGRVRLEVAWALAQIDPTKLPRALPVVMEVLQDRDPLVRRQAVHVLGDWGPAARSAIPDLERLLKQSPNWQMQSPGHGLIIIGALEPPGRGADRCWGSRR